MSVQSAMSATMSVQVSLQNQPMLSSQPSYGYPTYGYGHRYKKKNKLPRNDMIKAAFKEYDEFGNGKMSTGNIKDCLQKLNFHIDFEDFIKMMKVLDPNCIGSIERENFIKFMKKLRDKHNNGSCFYSVVSYLFMLKRCFFFYLGADT